MTTFLSLIRKLLAVCLGAAVLLSLPTVATSASASGRAVLGDVSGNGAADTFDALMLFAHSAGQQTLDSTRFLQADVSRDGKVDTADALQVFRATAGGQSLLTPTADELYMLELINRERAAAGVSPLVFQTEYYDCAVLRAQEQVQVEGHTRPDGTGFRTTFEELGHAPWPYSGENLALYQSSVDIAMEQLMNSEGHRRNILRPDYTSVAIGIIRDSFGYRIYSQIFFG